MPNEPKIEDEVRRLGAALGERRDEVLARTLARSADADKDLNPALRERFELISTSSTAAVAQWMAGGSPEEGRETSRKAFETYGQLAAQRIASLNEVAKRTLRWRDTIAEMLRECGAENGISEQAVQRAVAMVQLTVDVTLVRMCECFEAERQKTDAELAFMATHDTLTGLPNRTLILDRGEQALARARRHETPVAALFIDIDNFKGINDTLGHDAGDELLRQLTARLDSVVRATDALGRLGGDEFVVIAEDLSVQVGPEVIAERLLEALKQPVRLARRAGDASSRSARASASRWACAPRPRNCCATPTSRCTRPSAKARTASWCSPRKCTTRSSTGWSSRSISRTPCPKSEFVLVYQPTFDLNEMRPTGVEALLRWNHPGARGRAAGRLHPAARGDGADRARSASGSCTRPAGRAPPGAAKATSIGMAVNVSARQLDGDEFVGQVEHALPRAASTPRR